MSKDLLLNQDTLDLINNPESFDPWALYEEGMISNILCAIEDKAFDFTEEEGDVSTKSGRDFRKSQAYKVTRSKTFIDGIGKDYTAKLKQTIKDKVDHMSIQRKRISSVLDVISERVRKPLTDYEDKQKALKQKAVDLDSRLSELLIFCGAPTSTLIRDRIYDVGEISFNDIAEDFINKLVEKKGLVLVKLDSYLKEAVKREEESAELHKLKKEKAQKEKIETTKKQIDDISIYDISNLPSSAVIQENISRLTIAHFEHVGDDADQLIEYAGGAIVKLKNILDASMEKEKEQAELDAFRKDKADRKAKEDKEEADKQQKKREEEIAEKAKKEAAEKIESDLLKAEEKAKEEKERKAMDHDHKTVIHTNIRYALTTKCQLSPKQSEYVVQALIDGDIPDTIINY